jgi:hypothetical protein
MYWSLNHLQKFEVNDKVLSPKSFVYPHQLHEYYK